MERLPSSELADTVSKQDEKLRKYESRLRDLVTAYKGLLREKEALEGSLTAIQNVERSTNKDDSVSKLTKSMAMLAAEKSRMEEAYLNDKKLVREQNEKIIRDLQEQLQNYAKQRQAEVDNIKAKLSFEIQEREREQTEHTLMLKELQTKLSVERRSKEKLEDKYVATNDPGNKELEKKFRDLNHELEATQRKLNRAEARTIETPQMLVQLQEEISQMKQNHVVALREERIKAKRAEETARKMCASQEERVAALEAKLAELSDTVGEYDRQRRRDQEVIQHLRENMNRKLRDEKTSESSDHCNKSSICDDDFMPVTPEDFTSKSYLHKLIDKLHNLKKEIISVNENLGSPVDMWSLFNMSGSSAQNLHLVCRAELTALKTECNLYKKQIAQSSNSKNNSRDDENGIDKSEADQLKYHIKTLQDKVEILNQQIEETEKESEGKINLMEQKIENEQISHKEEISEYKNRIQALEQLLQAQRDRYSTLLSERECEIRTRQEKGVDTEKNSKYDINSSLQEVSAPPHMLHYVHELSRKDLEISALRKEKHIIEGQLRDTQRDLAIEKDRFKDVRRNLKFEIDRLRRIQSREGANLEYLKNVVLSYLLTTDSYSKKHMLNAIAAVLHFTDSEKESAYKVVS